MCLSKYIVSYFIHCGLLSLFSSSFNFSRFGVVLFFILISFSISPSSTNHYLLSSAIVLSQYHFYISIASIASLLFIFFNHVIKLVLLVTYSVSASFAINHRLSQFQMSWLQSCWATKQTLALWSPWSHGDASFTDPLGYVYLCPRPGGRALETLGRATPPVSVCSALS